MVGPPSLALLLGSLLPRFRILRQSLTSLARHMFSRGAGLFAGHGISSTRPVVVALSGRNSSPDRELGTATPSAPGQRTEIRLTRTISQAPSPVSARLRELLQCQPSGAVAWIR